jgi:hypothetical protein
LFQILALINHTAGSTPHGSVAAAVAWLLTVFPKYVCWRLAPLGGAVGRYGNIWKELCGRRSLGHQKCALKGTMGPFPILCLFDFWLMMQAVLLHGAALATAPK